jgi:hypothetical protein
MEESVIVPHLEADYSRGALPSLHYDLKAEHEEKPRQTNSVKSGSLHPDQALVELPYLDEPLQPENRGNQPPQLRNETESISTGAGLRRDEQMPTVERKPSLQADVRVADTPKQLELERYEIVGPVEHLISNEVDPAEPSQTGRPNHDVMTMTSQGVLQPSPNKKRAQDDDFTMHRFGFDPYKKADFKLAQKHRECKLVRNISWLNREDNQNIDFEACECCGYPFVSSTQSAPVFSVCVPSFELKEIGPGFPLYFSFTKYLNWILVFIVLAFSIPAIVDNVQADHYDDWEGSESSNVLIRMSVGNHGDPDDEDEAFPLWQSIMNILMMALMYVAYYLIRARQHVQTQVIDDAIVTPGDYAILVKGLPAEFSKEEISEFFAKQGRKDGVEVVVDKVNLPYKIKEFVEKSKTHESLKNLLFDKQAFEEANPGQTFQERRLFCCKKPSRLASEIEQECEEITKQLLDFIDRAETGDVSLLVGQAFVTFRRQESADAVVAFWGGNQVKRFWSRLFNSCRKKKVMTEHYKFDPKHLIVEAAPEPNDIIWENIGTTFMEKLKARLRTYMFCLLALAASFVMIYFASYYQESIQSDYDNTPESDRTKSDLVKVRMMSILPSVGVVVINIILEKVIRTLTYFEKHETLTEYNSSVALKLTFAQVVNTALIAFIVNLDWKNKWFVPGGLIEDMTWILISNALVQPLLKIFNVQHLVKYIQRRRAPNDPTLTQSEANEIFEEPFVDMAKCYACLMKTFIVTVIYAPILPFGVVVSVVGVFLMYWTDKYMLLRRHARPNRMSCELSTLMTGYLPFTIFLYSVSNYCFILVLNPSSSVPAFAWMIVCVGMICLPIETMYRFVRGQPVYQDNPESDKNKNYEDEAGYFIDDYDRQNPVTVDEGWDWYNSLVARKGIRKPDEVTDIQSSDVGMAVNLNKYAEQRIIEDNSHLAAPENQAVLEIAGYTGDVEDASKRKSRATLKLLGGYGMPQKSGMSGKQLKKLRKQQRSK